MIWGQICNYVVVPLWVGKKFSLRLCFENYLGGVFPSPRVSLGAMSTQRGGRTVKLWTELNVLLISLLSLPDTGFCFSEDA